MASRQRTRTAKIAERSFVEEYHRTNVIPTPLNEKKAMRFVFATLVRTAERWSPVAVSVLERHQLRLLRNELGIDPPPTSKGDKTTEKTIAA